MKFLCGGGLVFVGRTAPRRTQMHAPTHNAPRAATLPPSPHTRRTGRTEQTSHGPNRTNYLNPVQCRAEEREGGYLYSIGGTEEKEKAGYKSRSFMFSTTLVLSLITFVSGDTHATLASPSTQALTRSR